MNMAYELEITSVTAWVQIMGAHLVPLAEDAGDRIYGVGCCEQAVEKKTTWMRQCQRTRWPGQHVRPTLLSQTDQKAKVDALRGGNGRVSAIQETTLGTCGLANS